MPPLQLWSDFDYACMRRAINLAERAASKDEVPVGAVLAFGDSVEGEGHNEPVSLHDPTAHAEIQALRAAAKAKQNYRLAAATLYVTLEPCVMCAGAIVAARVKRLVFGARDIRFGGVRSVFKLADSELQNHRVSVEEGLLAPEIAEQLQRFFQQRR